VPDFFQVVVCFPDDGQVDGDRVEVQLLSVQGVAAAVIVTVLVPLTPESSVAVAVTVTVPTVVGVNNPVDESIVAVPFTFLTDQITTGLEALAGSTVAPICSVELTGVVDAAAAPVTFILDTLVMIWKISLVLFVSELLESETVTV